MIPRSYGALVVRRTGRYPCLLLRKRLDFLASSHHGKGIMTAAIKTFIHEWALPRMGVRQIRVETFSDNTGSRRVFEKLGFTYEKTVPIRKTLNSGRIIDGMDVLCWEAK